MKPANRRTVRSSASPISRIPGYLSLALWMPFSLAGCTDTVPRGDEASGAATLERSSQNTRTPRDTRVLTERFRRTLANIQANEELPGAVAAFILPEGRIGVASAGRSDVEAGTTMAPHARLQSGSIGKTFVSAVAISLALEGKLDLDALAAQYVGDRPWFERLPNRETITVRHLMTHSSGLPDHVYDPDFAADIPGHLEKGRSATMTPEELIEYILDDDPLFSPGQGYAYTDTGYLVLGRVIEAAAGSTYYDLLNDRFLGPLGLEFTVPSAPRVEYQAAGYLADDNPLGLPTKTLQDGVMVFNPEIEWTGGGLSTNPADLVKWGKALYEGTAMNGEYLDELLGSMVPFEPGADEGYGLGVYIGNTPFGRSYGHGGWFPGYRSQLLYFPDHRIAIAFQTNTDVDVNITSILGELTEVVLESLQ